MKKSDVIIGMKVVPFKKSVFYRSSGGVCKARNPKKNLGSSICWQRAVKSGQGFLYVQGFGFSHKGVEYVELSNTNSGADFFLFGDFKPYKEEK